MELGTSTRVTQKTVALRELKPSGLGQIAHQCMVINGGVVSHMIKGRGQNGSHMIALGFYFLLVQIGSPYLFLCCGPVVVLTPILLQLLV